MWELLLHGVLSVCMPVWVSVLLSTPFLWKQLSVFRQSLMSILCSLSLVAKIKCGWHGDKGRDGKGNHAAAWPAGL